MLYQRAPQPATEQVALVVRNRCHQRLPRLWWKRCEAAHFVEDSTQAQLGVEDVVVASIDPAKFGDGVTS